MTALEKSGHSRRANQTAAAAETILIGAYARGAAYSGVKAGVI